MKTDLFSYIGPDRRLVRQELVFMGRAVQWTADEGVSTGLAGDFDAPSAPASTPVEYADGRAASPRILMEASLLLRAHGEGDYYVTHLRKQVNDRLRATGNPATEIEELDEAARKELERLYEISQEMVALPPAEESAGPARRPMGLIVLGFLLGAGLALALYLIAF